jgi:hypothetical protein
LKVPRSGHDCFGVKAGNPLECAPAASGHAAAAPMMIELSDHGLGVPLLDKREPAELALDEVMTYRNTVFPSGHLENDLKSNIQVL